MTIYDFYQNERIKIPYPCGRFNDGRANCVPLRTRLTAAAFDVDCLDDRRLDDSSELRDDLRGL